MSTELLKFDAVMVGGSKLAGAKSGGFGWIAMDGACSELGLNPSGQRQRLMRQPWAETMVFALAEGNLKRSVLCLRSDKVAMWLATIDTSRLANDEARAKLVRWQCEAADVLDRWARGGDDRPVTMADLQRVLADLGHTSQADFAQAMEGMAASQRKMGEIVVEIRRGLREKTLPQQLEIQVACNIVELLDHTGMSRSTFYRVLGEHPEIRERCQRGRGWLIDATLKELARLGVLRRRMEGRITAPEFERCIDEAPGKVLSEEQLADLSGEPDPSLPWQACECRVGTVIDRAVLAAILTFGSLAGTQTIAAATSADVRTVRRSIRRLQETGALLVEATEPGQERRYHVLQRQLCTHTTSCTRRPS